MKDKLTRGFTLIEMVISVGLLAILAIIIIVNINKNLKDQQTSEYAEFIDKIKSAANVYMAANNDAEHYAENNEFYIITVEELETAGLLDLESTINPKTNKSIKSLDINDEYKYVKIYKDEKTNMGNSNATLIEYPVNGTNNFHYIITYKLGEFGHGCDTQIVPINNNIVELCVPSDDNANFLSWYLDEKLEKEFTPTNNNEKIYEINTNLTLYGKWQEIPKAPKIEYFNITSTKDEYNASKAIVEFKITDESDTDVEYCFKKNSEDCKSNEWKVLTNTKDNANPYIKDGYYKQSNYATGLSIGTGASATFYLLVRNKEATEIAKESKEYKVYKYCDSKVEKSTTSCNTCSSKCWSGIPGEEPTCEKTRNYKDKYFSSQSCGSEKIKSTCNTDKLCCAKDKVVTKVTKSSCVNSSGITVTCGGGTQTVTTNYVSSYDNNIKCGEATVKNNVACATEACCKKVTKYICPSPLHPLPTPEYYRENAQCYPQCPCVCYSDTNGVRYVYSQCSYNTITSYTACE
jgi:prepilin-type N-terminal cleavage/methylation domain-containing protein